MKIDYNEFIETLPEYYLNKATELENKYRVKIIATKESIDEMGIFGRGIKVGDIGSQLPQWPIEPKEAFELFKDYYARKNLFNQVELFLFEYYKWNPRAMEDELKKINQFIDKTKDIDLHEAYNYPHKCGLEQSYYLKLSTGYYDHNHIKHDSLSATPVYGKRFLFKELLEEKLGVISNIENEEKTLKAIYTIDQQKEICKNLIKEKLIKKISENEFVYLFTEKPIKNEMIKVNWLDSKGTAHEFLKRFVFDENEFDFTKINKCFKFKNNILLDSNDKSRAQYKNETKFNKIFDT